MKNWNMRTITIDIINKKALKLLREMELSKLIRLHLKQPKKEQEIDWLKYKGKMNKQPVGEINQQLNDLRREWE